jgi:hypothetical protein
MNKEQLGRKDRPGIEQHGKPRQGEEKGRPGNRQRPQRDQLDDQGVQRHMGHGDQKDARGRRHPIEGGDQSDEGGPELDDGTEGTSRQLEPSR